MALSFKGWRNYVTQIRTPETFTLRESLEAINCDTSTGTPVMLSHQDSKGSGKSFEEPAALEAPPRGQSLASRCCRLILIPPGSNLRISWDLLATVFLGWDIIMIPMSSFNPSRDGVIEGMEWITLVYWTGDMLMSLLTGVVVKGVTHMEPGIILKTYLKTWFCLDVVVVGPDWVFTFMAIFGSGSKGGAASSGRLLRILRILRTARLLRLAKLQRIALLMRDRIDSEMTFIMINIFKLVSMLLMLNHFLASLWWLTGSAGVGNSPNWIDTMNFAPDDVAYRYLTALHWSICMFTPGSMSVQPQSSLERGVAIFILVCGLVVFTAFISSMTASINSLKLVKGDKAKDLWMLRRFLRQHAIHKELAFRILRYVDNALLQSKGRKVGADKVPALKLLTDQLRLEVEYEANYKCLTAHPLFLRIVGISKVTMFRLVGSALSQRPLARTDVLFSGGGSANSMHFVVSGQLGYVKTSDINDPDCPEVEVLETDWLCEPVLWTAWTHYGLARAVATSVLASIKSDAFLDVIRMDHHIAHTVGRYARKFVEHLSSIGRGLLSDVSSSEDTISFAQDILEACEHQMESQVSVMMREQGQSPKDADSPLKATSKVAPIDSPEQRRPSRDRRSSTGGMTESRRPSKDLTRSSTGGLESRRPSKERRGSTN